MNNKNDRCVVIVHRYILQYSLCQITNRCVVLFIDIAAACLCQ